MTLDREGHRSRLLELAAAVAPLAPRLPFRNLVAVVEAVVLFCAQDAHHAAEVLEGQLQFDLGTGCRVVSGRLELLVGMPAKRRGRTRRT